MISRLFSFSFKRIFKSWFCWGVMIITSIIFFVSMFGFLNLGAEKIDNKKAFDRVGFRGLMSLLSFLFLSLSLSNLTQFVIDKPNLIFIISKHYERLKVLCVKLLVYFLFVLIFLGFLVVNAYILNIYSSRKFHGALWRDNKDFFINFCLQMFLLMIYNILFWSIISLYFSQKAFTLLVSIFQFVAIFLHFFIYLILLQINDDITQNYVVYVKEVLLNNLFFCPISFVTFVIGISCFYKMDLRI